MDKLDYDPVDEASETDSDDTDSEQDKDGTILPLKKQEKEFGDSPIDDKAVDKILQEYDLYSDHDQQSLPAKEKTDGKKPTALPVTTPAEESERQVSEVKQMPVKKAKSPTKPSPKKLE